MLVHLVGINIHYELIYLITVGCSFSAYFRRNSAQRPKRYKMELNSDDIKFCEKLNFTRSHLNSTVYVVKIV